MTRDLESRLRAALHDHADGVTPARLTRTLDDAVRDDPHTGALGRRPGQSWLVAAAAAVVVAAGASGIVLATRQSSPSPQPVATVTVTPAPTSAPAPAPTPSPSVTTSAAPGAAAPHEEPRGAIPWAQVGPGWSAASWATSSQAPSATLYLVSPSGTRYAIGAIPQTGVYDITPDGRRILTGSNDPNAVLEWDVAAGTSRSIPLGQQGATYTKPDGKALFTTDLVGTGTRMERRGLDGSVQLTFPAETGLARMTPDGLDLVAGTTSGLAVYGNATGTLIRTLPAPSGYGSCQVVSWWPDGRALTRCALGGNGVANLWLYPLDGSPATALTAATAASATPFGYQDAWPVSTGTLVQEGVGCGVGPLAMLTSPGTSQRIAFTLPGFSASTHPVPDPVAVVGDVAYLVVSTAECGGAQTRSLVAYDVVTGRSGVLIGPGANGGTAGPVAVIDPSH